MATIETDQPATGLLDRLLGALHAWDDARAARAALRRFSRRELSDIGLERGELDLSPPTRRR